MMRRGWKKIFLQWVCPAVALLVIIVLLFLRISSAMDKSLADSYEDSLVATAEPYAVRLGKELAQMSTAGSMIANVAFGEMASDKLIETVLASSVKETELYEALICRPDGSALMHDGSTVSLAETEYYEWSTGLSGNAYRFVEDDGITGEAALLLAIPSTDCTQRVILYYPVKNIKSMISMSKEFDGKTVIAVLDQKGSVMMSADEETPFFQNPSFWNNIDEDCRVEISQAKRDITERKSGCAHLRASGEERTVIYVPVGDWTLLAGVDEAYVGKAEALYGKKLTLNLHQMLLVTVLGVVFLTVHNFISSLTALKGTKVLKEKADTDQLTGLGNKLSTENRIKAYIAENPESLAVMFVLDIDNFKKINDTMGHAFGDEVLRELGRQIGVNFRVTDIIGRTGGDEFTIFLKNLKDESNTVREARKLEYFFQHFQVGDYVKYSATASIGAAVFPADGADFETLYKAADAALYKAKKRGKNQLAFFDDRQIQS